MKSTRLTRILLTYNPVALEITEKVKIAFKDEYCIEKTKLKKFCFRSPTTLLGLSESGNLLCCALNEKLGTVTIKPHFIRHNGKDIHLHTFAVNPYHLNQVILCTKQGELLYLNLKDCLKPLKQRKVQFLKQLSELPDPDSVWFYGNNICLGKYQSLETQNFSFYDLDLRIEKKDILRI